MVLFEVAEASIHSWKPSEDTNSQWNGIYLEVYIEVEDRKSCLRCSRTRGGQHARGRTATVEEACEMFWRTRNDDGFLVELFTLCELRVHARQGDVLPLAVDVFRSQDSHGKGSLVSTLRGQLPFGAWGSVVVRAADDGDYSGTRVTLEVRPMSTRPFVLENAQVTEQCVPIEAFFKQAEGEPLPASWIPFRAGTHFTAPFRKSLQAAGQATEARSSRRDSTRSTTRGRRSSMLQGLNLGRTARGSTRKSGIAHPWAAEPEATGPSTLLGKLLTKVTGHQHVDGLESSCQQWVPRDWAATWQCSSATFGGQAAGVVPVMEAEFRRDAVVLFNTLFPRRQGRGFAALRLAAAGGGRPGPRAPQQRGLRRAASSLSSQVGNSYGLAGDHSLSFSLKSRGCRDGEVASSGNCEQDSASSSHETRKRNYSDGSRLLDLLSPDLKVALHADVIPPGGPNPSSLGRARSAEEDALVASCTGFGECFVDDYSLRIMLLKRLFICFAVCGVYFTEVGNSTQLGDPWPYPLAAVLGHGSRVLIRLEDIEGSEFVNFLLTGDPGSSSWKEAGVPRPLQRRIAATHAVELSEDGQLVERKLSVLNAADSVQNLSDGFRKKHLGLNLPIGGVGNPSPLGVEFVIGFHGEVWKQESQKPRRGPGPAQGPSAEGGARGPRRWRALADVQGGHLYLRLDDFGERLGAPARSAEERRRALRAAERRALLAGRGPGALALGQLGLSRRLRALGSPAGELRLPGGAPELPAPRPGALTGGEAAGGLRLLRVRSAPSLAPDGGPPASGEDVRWARCALLAASGQALPAPPSPAALRLLLEHYDPANSQLFGTGRFKSLFEFYMELKRQTSFLVKDSRGLQRFCEPVLLQVCWRGHVLMKINELLEGKDCLVPKNSFIATRLMPREDWRAAVFRIVETDLHFDEEAFMEMLEPSAAGEDEACHRVIRETAVSPSYPGLLSSYCTHMVRWEVREDSAWPRAHSDLTFVTASVTEEGPKRVYWRWVPLAEAQNLQRFVNMGDATADEQWAKYAFQKEGVVQFPPTEAALSMLLRRCGIDVEGFGIGPGGGLGSFWKELTTQESSLQMSDGHPLRVVDATVVKVRWKPQAPEGAESSCYKVLVQVLADSHSDPRSDPHSEGASQASKKLFTTRKRREEKAEDAAARCLEAALGLTRQELKAALQERQPDAAPQCMFHEERKDSNAFPGIQCLYRTHLVSWKVKDDIAASPLAGALALTPDEGAVPFMRSASSKSRLKVPASQRTPAGAVVGGGGTPPRPQLEWLDDCALAGVRGADLWERALGPRERHRVSSVLLGLEGAAPGMRSPFGAEHSAAGTSASTSALGGHKWRAYRSRGALQVPADVGGLRMRVTRGQLEELARACGDLGLTDPGLDLLEPVGARPRAALERGFAERELFKRLLSCSAGEARAAVASLREYRAAHRTAAQLHGAAS